MQSALEHKEIQTMTKTTLSNNELNDKQIIGNAGMYYVCYLLSQKGWNAMPTARNAKGIDIVAYSEDGKCITIQVKTFFRTKNKNITTFKKDESIIWDYLFIVHLSDKTLSGDEMPNVYVVSKQEAKEKSIYLMQYGKHYCLVEGMYKDLQGKHEFDNVWNKTMSFEHHNNQEVKFHIEISPKKKTNLN